MMKRFMQWTQFIIGLFVVSIGIVLTIKADLGVAPWDVFHIGVTKYINLTVGRVSQLTGLFILLFSYVIDRVKPTIGTIINIIIIGFMIDLMMVIIPEPTQLSYQYIYLFIGTIIFGLGVGIYISAHCGAGPRDSLMLALNQKLDVNVSRVKIGMELGALTVGYIIGGPVGVGTLFMAFGSGPVIEFSLNFLNDFSSSSILN
jgi:uncharacterized membrane protein YczE